mmetsp:Transcript_27546/g.110345  ORF Transcript_27546/g.110345 Transcript_27546/m.110345 type:complete len:141 (-) Transcript_27546:619-1041(-)
MPAVHQLPLHATPPKKDAVPPPAPAARAPRPPPRPFLAIVALTVLLASVLGLIWYASLDLSAAQTNDDAPPRSTSASFWGAAKYNASDHKLRGHHWIIDEWGVLPYAHPADVRRGGSGRHALEESHASASPHWNGMGQNE